MSGAAAPGGDEGGHAAAERALAAAGALVGRDLAVTVADAAGAADVLAAAVAGRAWWVRAWPQGGVHVAGQVAQDVQEALAEQRGVRWPLCPGTPGCDGAEAHELRIDPDLGPDPHWVCEESATALCALGDLARVR